MNDKFEEYKQVQSIAKKVLNAIPQYISSESTEFDIAEKCKDLLKEYDITKTWYYNCPALVLLGSRSCLSISGKDYIPSHEKVSSENLITIDLSPLLNNSWGDCSRSFVFEKGKFVEFDSIESADFKEGLQIENRLHTHFKNFVKIGMTYSQIYTEMNNQIKSLEYENLDFGGNVGHSIEINKDDRLYFEKNNIKNLTSDKLFTFEPHIKKTGSNWGFKLENIYYFDENGCVIEL